MAGGRETVHSAPLATCSLGPLGPDKFRSEAEARGLYSGRAGRKRSAGSALLLAIVSAAAWQRRVWRGDSNSAWTAIYDVPGAGWGIRPADTPFSLDAQIGSYAGCVPAVRPWRVGLPVRLQPLTCG